MVAPRRTTGGGNGSCHDPHRADSDLWYRAAFPDGRSGYLSEVYVNGEDRGGLGLPSCGPG